MCCVGYHHIVHTDTLPARTSPKLGVSVSGSSVARLAQQLESNGVTRLAQQLETGLAVQDAPAPTLQPVLPDTEVRLPFLTVYCTMMSRFTRECLSRDPPHNPRTWRRSVLCCQLYCRLY